MQAALHTDSGSRNALQQLLTALQQQQQEEEDHEAGPPVGSGAASAAAGIPASASITANSSGSTPAEAAAAVSDIGGAAETAARQAVEQIRARDFGVGLQLQGQASELVMRQSARLGRALARLSKELYSSNTHFVLELVQVRIIVHPAAVSEV